MNASVTNEQLNQYEKHGFVILRNVISPVMNKKNQDDLTGLSERNMMRWIEKRLWLTGIVHKTAGIS